ncbi:MAG: N-acetylglucosaminyltransferase [Proteobacteria bacterium]|jgi:beta-1,4-mannosyl-glycoprotein beta-1,4-N-acetylglucosaminyltransferase|nr:N-acetylglucosaminyltransferase [Pseudomonadota bacterium]
MLYDCFVFYNELDLLEIRLKLLDSVIDRFVIVEGDKDFSGDQKKLHFLENKSRFRPYLHKIDHLVATDFPKFNWKKLRPAKNWDRERYQRNFLGRGISKAQVEDWIIVSDVDEIPNPEKVRAAIGAPGIYCFYQELYYYYLNLLVTDHPEPNPRFKDYVPWHGPVMFQLKDLKKDPETMRTLRGSKSVIPIKEGGWHFSFLGGSEAILKKMKAYSHTEYIREEMLNIEWIEQKVRSGEDIFGRQFKFKKVGIERLPSVIQENVSKYSSLILRDS